MITEQQIENTRTAAACVAGVLSAHPFFQEQGLRWNLFDGIHMGHGHEHGGIFTSAYRLFGYTHIFDGGHSGLAGKRQALSRIRGALYREGAITLERTAELAAQEAALTE